VSNAPSKPRRKKGPRRPKKITFFDRVKWRIEQGAYLAMEKVLGAIPLEVVFDFGEKLGDLAWHFAKARREDVTRNLRIALSETHSPEACEALCREVFRRSGGNLLTSLSSTQLPTEIAASHVKVVNPELAVEALSHGKGAIVVIPHMGNWEILTQITKSVPGQVFYGAHYRPLNNPYLDAHIRISRERAGMKLFSKRSSLHELSTFLREGGILAILGDQRTGHVGELQPFFGRLTSCTPMPALLARRTGAALLVGSTVTTQPAHWQIQLEALPQKATTAQCMQALERAMRRSPVDVFWFQDRWRIKASRPFSQEGKVPKEPFSSALKPRRVLVWLNDESSPLPEIPVAEFDDLQIEYASPKGSDSRLKDVIFHRAASCSATEIRSIDLSHPLPLDFIVSTQATEELERATKDVGLILWKAKPAE
jgi:Kdo2-lipid IVA lauroyltransferase/acyltransferase